MQIFKFNKQFYLLNFIQAIERIALWILIIYLPIYTAQDGVGGLNFSHTQKGVVFALWALSQNLSMAFLGGILADNFGRKKILIIATVLCSVFILLLSITINYWLFLIVISLLGISSGFFKPALQGSVSNSIGNGNQSVGWGIYTWSINLAIFALGTPIATFLKNYFNDWSLVFQSAAIIHLLAVLPLIFIENSINTVKSESLRISIVFNYLKEKRVLYFIISITTFTMAYMQFYENLPNYIFDWINTNDLVSQFKLSDRYTTTTQLGKVVSYEWLYNLNTGLILLFNILIAFLIKKYENKNVLRLSIITTLLGLLICGYTNTGWLLIIGISVYTFGEMIANPRINIIASSFSNEQNKSQYLGLTGIAWSLGLGIGAVIGGLLYDKIADKPTLAIRYIQEVLHQKASSLPLEQIATTLNISTLKATELLYSNYAPWHFWFYFLALNIIGFYFLLKKLEN